MSERGGGGSIRSVFLFNDDMVVNVENPKEFTKELYELMRVFSQDHRKQSQHEIISNKMLDYVAYLAVNHPNSLVYNFSL